MDADKVASTVRKKNPVPAGLQNLLNRLAKLALSNSPCCYYECFATALESDLDWRSLTELQLSSCTTLEELAVHRHEHGDVQLHDWQSADLSQESAASEHRPVLANGEDLEVHNRGEVSEQSAAVDDADQQWHERSVLDKLPREKDTGTTSDLLCQSEVSYSLLGSSSNAVMDAQQRSSPETSHGHLHSEASHSLAGYARIHTSEVDEPLEQSHESDNLMKVQAYEQSVTGWDNSASSFSKDSSSDSTSSVVANASGVLHVDLEASILRQLATTSHSNEAEQSHTIEDQLRADYSNVAAGYASGEQMVQDPLSWFCSMLGEPENVTTGLTSTGDFQQNSDFLNAGIYSSLSGMQITDDMELIPVAGLGTVENAEGIRIAKDTTAELSSVTNTTGLNSYTANEPFHEEKEREGIPQLSEDSLEAYKAIDAASDYKQLENIFRDSSGQDETQHVIEVTRNCNALDMDNTLELKEESDSSAGFLIPAEYASEKDLGFQSITAGYDGSQELEQFTSVFTSAVKAYSSSKEVSGPNETDVESHSAADSAKTAAEAPEMETLISLEPIPLSSDGTSLNDTTESQVYSEALKIDTSCVSSMQHHKITEYEEIAYDNSRGDLHTDKSCIDLEPAEDFTSSPQQLDASSVQTIRALPTVHYASEGDDVIAELNTEELESLIVNDDWRRVQRVETDDLTVTVTCFLPEDSEQSQLDDDTEDGYDGREMTHIPTSEKLADPGLSSNEHNVSAEKALQNRRSADFMLPYLMPIDETAELLEETAMNNEDEVTDKSHSLQPADSIVSTGNVRKTEDDDSEGMQATSTVDTDDLPTAHKLCHEPTTHNVNHSNVLSTSETSDTEQIEGASSLVANECDSMIPATCSTEVGGLVTSADERSQIMTEEGITGIACERHSQTMLHDSFQQADEDEQELVRNDKNKGTADAMSETSKTVSDDLPDISTEAKSSEHISEAVSPPLLAWSADPVTNMEGPVSNDETGTLPPDVQTETSKTASDADLFDISLETKSSEHISETVSPPLTVSSADPISNTGDNSLLQMAEHSPSVTETEAFDTSLHDDQHITGTSVFSRSHGMNELVEQLVTNSLETEASFSDSEARVEWNSEPCNQTAESVHQLHEQSVLQSSDILLDFEQPETPAHVQETMSENQSSLQTNDSIVDPGSVPAESRSPPADAITAPADVDSEKPAVEAITDLESTLEMLHGVEDTADTT